jgi:hypothetical protein
MQFGEKYYRPSGKFELLGLIYMLVFGAIGAVLLGAIYGYGVFYIPLVMLNLLLVVAYGFCVGLCVQYGAKRGKVRNSTLLLLGGLVAGLMAEYANWVWYIFALSKQETLAYMPGDVWQIILNVNAQGVWSVFDSTPTGIELWLYWGAEALVIVGIAAIVPWLNLQSAPFCEQCSRWVEGKDKISPLDAVADRKGFKSRLEQGDYAPIKALKVLPQETSAFTTVTLLKCPGCQSSNYLTVQAVTLTKDKKGKVSRNQANILENMILSSDNYRNIKSALQGS